MADYVNCDNPSIPTADIIKGLFAEDASGNIGIRVILGTDNGTSPLNCDNASQLTPEKLMRLSIESTPNGPALRLLQ